MASVVGGETPYAERRIAERRRIAYSGASARPAAGAGIWAGLSLLISLFIGGMAATRIGAVFDRTTGFLEGALVRIVSPALMAPLAAAAHEERDALAFPAAAHRATARRFSFASMTGRSAIRVPARPRGRENVRDDRSFPV